MGLSWSKNCEKKTETEIVVLSGDAKWMQVKHRRSVKSKKKKW